MLRITGVQEASGHTALRLEGRVVGPWVDELARHCEAAFRADRSVTLDMAGVSFLDAAGIHLVGTLTARGVRLVDCSPFVSEQLQGGQDATCTTR